MRELEFDGITQADAAGFAPFLALLKKPYSHCRHTGIVLAAAAVDNELEPFCGPLRPVKKPGTTVPYIVPDCQPCS